MTLASKITLVRVAFIPVFMILMYLSGGEIGFWMWLALAVFIIASLTDYVDGQIARKQNQETRRKRIQRTSVTNFHFMATLIS